MADKRINKLLKVRIITIAALLAVIFLLMALGDHPQLVERYYSEGLYPLICYVLHPLFNLFPFCMGDIIYIAVIGYLVYALIMLIKLAFKKEFKRVGIFLLGITIGVQTGLLIFYLFWGLNYFRPPAGELFKLRDSSYSIADLKAVTTMLIDSANASRIRLTPQDLSESNHIIYQTAIQAIQKLSNDSVKLRTYDPNVKPSLLTPMLNYIGTSGYYNPFTGEAQMNYQMPIFSRPVTACHEMSHQMGFGTEDEANFVGFLAGIGSHNRLLRYSAYHLAVGEFMIALYFRDSLQNKQLRLHESAAVHNDFKIERAYWHSYQSKAEVLSSIFYDKFLKANNQPQGLNTYNRMVLLVMAMYRAKAVTNSP
jgi:hypothetical protein